MITLLGLERIVPYIDQSTDTGEVAEKLENTYKVIERFYNFIEKDFEKQFNFYLERDSKGGFEKAFNSALFSSADWLTNQWRSYIEKDLTGIKTKASRMRGDPSFLDTGNYYSNTIFVLKDM